MRQERGVLLVVLLSAALGANAANYTLWVHGRGTGGQPGNHAIRHLVNASEVADVAAFLCSPRSLAINGDAIAVGGGAPRSIHY